LNDEITQAELLETLAFVVEFHAARDRARNANHCNPTAYHSKLTSRLMRLERLAKSGRIKVEYGG
jgi:hypothetical protein